MKKGPMRYKRTVALILSLLLFMQAGVLSWGEQSFAAQDVELQAEGQPADQKEGEELFEEDGVDSSQQPAAGEQGQEDNLTAPETPAGDGETDIFEPEDSGEEIILGSESNTEGETETVGGTEPGGGEASEDWPADELLIDESGVDGEAGGAAGAPLGMTSEEWEALQGGQTGAQEFSGGSGDAQGAVSDGSEDGMEAGNGIEEENELETEAETETEIETEGLLEDLDPQVVTSGEEIEEAVELNDATRVPDSAPAGIMMFSLTSYQGCFGNQLDQVSRELYDQRVSYYVTNKGTGSMTVTYSAATSPIQYEVVVKKDASGAAIKDEDGKYILDTDSQEYKAFQADVRFAMQSSVDAFLYDHPEIFWFRGGGYSYASSWSYNASTGKGTGYLSRITYTPGVAFSGADSAAVISAYDAALPQVAAQISQNADYNGDGVRDDAELARGIHDYLCDTLYYDSDSYAGGAYEQSGDYRIFCSAGAILPGTVGAGVVCEGYAKGFKVLCDQLGIPCALIGGTVTQSGITEGHMWNGVQIGGKWYLVDATWDDKDTYISYDYFLAGNTFSNRVSSGNFGGSPAGASTIFTYPALETGGSYCALTGHDYTGPETVVPASCTTGGYTEYICNRCQAPYRNNKTEALGHVSQGEGTVVPATCTTGGYTEYICSRCGGNYRSDETAPLGHVSQGEGTVVPATCTAEGYTEYICSRCGDPYRNNETAALGHAYTTRVTAATCTAGGYTEYTCSRCGDTYRDNETAPLGHAYATRVVAPTCTSGGYTEHTCSRGDSSYRDNQKSALGHNYVQTANSATCTSAGYRTYTCSRCPVSYKTAQSALGHSYVNGLCSRCGAGDTIAKASIGSIANQSYTGKNIIPAVKVSFGSRVLKQGTDYTVSCRNNKNVGTATVTITGKGKYRGTRNTTFKIVKASMNSLKYSSVSDKTYSGKAQKPSVTVKNGTKKLTKNKDYTISYSKNKNVGRAVITIKGKSSYTGTKKIYFNIVPKKTSLTKVVSNKKGRMGVNWKKVTGITGYQIQYSTSSSFKNAKTVTVKGSTSRVIKGLKKGKTYYVRVRAYKTVNKVKYYSGWCGKKKVKIKK